MGRAERVIGDTGVHRKILATKSVQRGRDRLVEPFAGHREGAVLIAEGVEHVGPLAGGLTRN